MPLFEFLKMARAKLDSDQEKPTTSSTDLSSLPEDELRELTQEGDQVVMQGPSTRANKNNIFGHNLPSNGSKPKGETSADKTKPGPGKSRTFESGFDESPMTSEIGLSQDDDMVPWLGYPIAGSLQNGYCASLLPDLPAVTVNEACAQIGFEGIDKNSAAMYRESHAMQNGLYNLGQADVSEFSSAASGENEIARTSSTQLYLSSTQQLLPPFPCLQSRVPANACTNTRVGISHAVSGGTPLLPTSVVCSSVKAQRQDLGPPDNDVGFTNFSCFSWPAALSRTNDTESRSQRADFGLSSSRRAVSREKASASSVLSEVNFSVSSGSIQKQKIFGLKLSESKQIEERFSSQQSEPYHLNDASENAKLSSRNYNAAAVNGLTDIESITDTAGVSSSVCSGDNGVERVSEDWAHNLKRPRDTDESDVPSDDAEELTPERKPSAQGTNSKRSRAAEVHNLSERKRRDRINEKMRALQELIPNCNKVDKASVLDEAIKYLKSLQLQLQMMSMGAGLYIPPKILPTTMHPASAPHFPPLRVGMGLAMGFGMGMFYMNGYNSARPVIPVPSMQGVHFPSPLMSGMAGANLQMYGFPDYEVPLPHAPLVSFPGALAMKPVPGVSKCRMPRPLENLDSAVASGLKEAIQNTTKEALQNTGSSCLINQSSSQSALVQSTWQASDVDGRMPVDPRGMKLDLAEQPADHD